MVLVPTDIPCISQVSGERCRRAFSVPRVLLLCTVLYSTLQYLRQNRQDAQCICKRAKRIDRPFLGSARATHSRLQYSALQGGAYIGCGTFSTRYACNQESLPARHCELRRIIGTYPRAAPTPSSITPDSVYLLADASRCRRIRTSPNNLQLLLERFLFKSLDSKTSTVQYVI